MVGVQGFEPWTPWSQTRCATGLRYTPKTATCIADAKHGETKKDRQKYSTILKYWSEYKDSNLGPPGPKPGALPGCATLREAR